MRAGLSGGGEITGRPALTCKRLSAMKPIAGLEVFVVTIDNAMLYPPMPPEETGDRPVDPLQQSLRRCPAATYAAALEFRRTRAPECIPPIALGVLARFVATARRARLEAADHNLRLADDLGLDSLDRLQAVMLLEEVLQIEIRDEVVAELQTVGDVLRSLRRLVTGGAPESGSFAYAS